MSPAPVPPPSSPTSGFLRVHAVAAVLLVLAAFALQRSATSPWARATASDGARLVLTPVGLSRIQPGTQSVDCRWWPRWDKQALCTVAPGGERALSRLRAAAPLLQGGMWLAIGALFLIVLRVPKSPGVRGAVAWGATALVMAAIVLVMRSPRSALSALRDVPLELGAMGAVLAWAALILTFVAGLLELTRSRASA